MTERTVADRADARYRKALSGAGIEDVRPAFRELIKRLRRVDPAGYEEAVQRYQEELLPAVAGTDGSEGTGDPLVVWLRYGAWLADRLAEGRVVAVDATGRAETVEGDPPVGPLLVHLPDDQGEDPVLLASPAEPSDFQEATRELLIR